MFRNTYTAAITTAPNKQETMWKSTEKTQGLLQERPSIVVMAAGTDAKDLGSVLGIGIFRLFSHSFSLQAPHDLFF
jgi:hypothetical protein